ncbi:hypothetical protein [Nakamurella lactea]|uniref:hypothetical protein n=1 Tax=Nakamurella lactea TaxID=459515 RepID=UPI0003FBA84D|nr:hypothetical protein [Nakamurella lactea]
MADPTTGPVSGGVIGHRPVLDLSGLTAPEQLAGIAGIEQVAVVVVPRSLAAAYTAIPTRKVATTVFVPDGTRPRVHTGTLTVGGDGLGSADDALIVTGVLAVTGPVTGDLPALIHVTGTVLVPRGSEAAIGRVLEGTGSVVAYRWAETQEIRTHGGQLSISGAGLTNPIGEPDDVLVLAGQTVVTGEVGGIGYRQVVVVGQAAFPAAAQEALDPRLVAQGQVGWYVSDNPRTFVGGAPLAAEYLRLLEAPASLIVTGNLDIADDVSAELLRDKVSDIVVFGNITAPDALVPTLQYLATQAFGSIRGKGGSTD